MRKNDNDNKPVKLCNGPSVYSDILNFVLSVVLERIPDLSPDAVYTLEQIFGKKIWRAMEKINRIDAGYCMVHLVEKGQVPFIAVEGRHEYPKLYQLTSRRLGTRIP